MIVQGYVNKGTIRLIKMKGVVRKMHLMSQMTKMLETTFSISKRHITGFSACLSQLPY